MTYTYSATIKGCDVSVKFRNDDTAMKCDGYPFERCIITDIMYKGVDVSPIVHYDEIHKIGLEIDKAILNGYLD